MLKRTMALALALALLLALTACGGGGGSGTSGTTTPSTPSTPTTPTTPSAPSTPSSGGGKVGPDIKLRFSSQSSPGAMPLIVIEHIVDQIQTESGGAISIDLYPANQLGDWTTVFNEVMMGTIDIGHTSIPDSMDARIAAGYLLYLSTSYDNVKELYAEGGWLRTLLEGIYTDKMKIKYMGPSFQGFNGLGMIKELSQPLNPDVDKGVVIRCSSQTTVSEGLAALGFRTSSLPYSEVYTSLQTGIIDGWLGGTSNTNYVNFRDVINYYYDMYIQPEVNAFNISTATWERLSPEQQVIVEEAFRDGQEYMFSLVEDTMIESNANLKSEGIEVINYTPEELAPMAAKIRTTAWPKLSNIYEEGFLDELVAELTRIEQG